MTEQVNKKRMKTIDMVYIAIFAVIIAICTWIAIPMVIPFTMQTFGIFCALGMLGGKRGTISVLIYILLGMIGLPVFSNFNGGIGVLMGATGGYIVGFIFTALIYWGVISLLNRKGKDGKESKIKLWSMPLAMVLGLIVCYAFGTAWFMIVYAKETGPIGLAAALGWCVTPFILPELLKIALAVVISRVVPRHIRIS